MAAEGVVEAGELYLLVESLEDIVVHKLAAEEHDADYI